MSPKLGDTIAVLGARGFVGSAIVRALRERGIEPIEVVRGDPQPAADITINAACPSQRLRAEREPDWDFEESVVKTAAFYYQRAGRFLQVSSISARCPRNSVYGRHRAAAEMIVNDGLIVRLGPMYGEGLAKGVLADMIADRPVYMDPDTEYAFADVAWCASRIVDLALSEKTGIHDVGGRNAIRLGDIPGRIGSRSEFRPSEFLPIEHQCFISPDGPTPSLALEWARNEAGRSNPAREGAAPASLETLAHGV